MGYRLGGPSLHVRRWADMLSDATPMGSIQVTGSGQPILLMADRQTTGGYPRIATVISADLPLAGQLAPGDWIEFSRMLTRRGARRAASSRNCRWSGSGDDRLSGDCLIDAFGADRVGSNAPLAPFTTFKVGGPAEWLVTLHAARRCAQRDRDGAPRRCAGDRARRRIERARCRRRRRAARRPRCTAATSRASTSRS